MPAVVVPAVGVLAVLFGQVHRGGVACGHPVVHGIQQALVNAGGLGQQLLPVLPGIAGRALPLRPLRSAAEAPLSLVCEIFQGSRCRSCGE
jgi:hypothetical protein